VFKREYKGPSYSFGGNFQHGFPVGFNDSDSFNLISKMNLIQGEGLNLSSGFLGAQWFGADYWYSLFGSLILETSDFQSLEIKPFFQSAGLEGENLQEYGGNLNYHLNMAGLVESQLGFGFSHDDFLSTTNLNKYFFQTSEFLDILGPLTANLALRWDFSSQAETSFSDLFGIRANLGGLSVFANYSKGVIQNQVTDSQKLEAGIALQDSEEWLITSKYIHETLGIDSWDGGDFKLQWSQNSAFLWLFKKLNLTFEEEGLKNPGGNLLWDTGAQIRWSFFPQNTFWFAGRCISYGSIFCEIGGDFLVLNGVKIFTSVENIGNLPSKWPDLTLPQGTAFAFGLQTNL
jgi:hypothetical protein